MLITQGISSQGLLRYLNMNEKTLGQRIRERRKQVGLSQNGLSKAAGVSGSSISLWESDHTAPRGQNLHRLAEVLQCSPTWILFGDEDKTPAPPVSLDSALDLSEDELEMLRLYIIGMSYSEIAKKMGCSTAGVRWNFQEMISKAGYSCKEDLIAAALESKLLVTTLK